ncbi:MAG: MBL fold metallo-hydrolase [Alphaproteobacteria bacterium]|nr:MBL fold metallo-hydrolase [Alphaproteobacteria bacterium]
MIRILTTLLVLISQPAFAQLKPVKVTDNIYAIVGPLGNRGPGNLANNATFGVVITSDGLVLVDPGGTYHGAAQIDRTIRKFSDQPVRIVINSGGQDHRWIGNSYWIERGARIIASDAAVADQLDRESLQFTGLIALVGEFGLTGTEAMTATETFAKTMTLTLGDTTMTLSHIGAAHTPGDAFLWVPSESAVFTGDIVYTERLLTVSSVSNTVTWLQSFDAIAALEPEHLIPGHGNPTDLFTAFADTYDYLVNLRQQMAAHIEAGGDIIGAVKVDQSDFAYLQNFNQLAGRNAQAVFEAMEWE